MSEVIRPAISAVVCTRSRGSDVVETVESILKCGGRNFEIIVVDQSEDGATETSIAPYAARGDVLYIRSSTRGLAAARNVGIRAAKSDLIALTDDDCVVGESWLEEFIRVFSRERRIGIAHGNVLAGAHDSSSGFIPSYHRDKPFLAASMRDRHLANGIGACMGLRKQTWSTLGGFDEALGAGGRFQSAEELDLGLRALLEGISIYETPELYVVHRGFRRWADSEALLRGHLYGIGAMFAKLLKCGCWSVVPYMMQLGWRWLFSAPAVSFGKRPSRIPRLIGFVQGLLAGGRASVDRARMQYAPSPSIGSPAASQVHNNPVEADGWKDEDSRNPRP